MLESAFIQPGEQRCTSCHAAEYIGGSPVVCTGHAPAAGVPGDTGVIPPGLAFAIADGDGEARGAFGAGPVGAFGGGELGEAPRDVPGEPAGGLGDAAGLAFATAEGDGEAGGAFGLGAADTLGAAESAAGDPGVAGGEPAGGGEA